MAMNKQYYSDQLIKAATIMGNAAQEIRRKPLARLYCAIHVDTVEQCASVDLPDDVNIVDPAALAVYNEEMDKYEAAREEIALRTLAVDSN
jgi:uncharacterized protein (UPF0371 family)